MSRQAGRVAMRAALALFGAGIGAACAGQRVPPPAGPVATAGALTSPGAAAPPLRVCADPDNLPFSNRKREGFEDKIAEIIGGDLGTPVEYVYWPHRRGFLSRTLRHRDCDVLMGVPAGFDPVAETTPYYRSTYYLVTRSDRPAVTSLDDPALRSMKVGVTMIGTEYTNTPPAHALSTRGVKLIGFSTFYGEGSSNHPQDIVNAVASGDVDVAVVWGPLAGYFAKRQPVPLRLVALPDSDALTQSGLPFAYDIGIGVRRSDRALKTAIDGVLARRRPEIARVLREYAVPTVERATVTHATPTQ